MVARRIWEGDLTKLVVERWKPKAFSIAPVKMTISVETKEICKVIEGGDGLLAMELNDAASETMKIIATDVAKKLEVIDAKCIKDWLASLDMTEVEEDRKKFLNQYADLAEQAPKKVQESARKVWEAYCKTRKDLFKYKMKVNCKVGLAVVGVGTGIAVAASAGLGNLPGLVAGTLTAAKSLSTAIQTYRKGCMPIEVLGADIRKDLAALNVSYQHMSKTAATGSEIVSKVVEAFTTKNIGSIEQTEKDIALFKQKLVTIKPGAHKASQELDKVLDGNEMMEKEIKAIKAKGVTSTLVPLLEKSEKNVDVIIKSITELPERMKKAKKAAEQAEKAIGELKKKTQEKVVKWVGLGIDVTVIALEVWGGFGAGGAESTSKFLEDPAEKADLVATSVNLLKEAITVAEKQMKK